MSAGNDWLDARHMGGAAVGGIVEALTAFTSDAANVEVTDLTPHRKNGEVGAFRVRVSDEDGNIPGQTYTVVVT